MADHEHDYWRTPGGGLVCACGKSKGPALAPSPAEQAEIDRFGILEKTWDEMTLLEKQEAYERRNHYLDIRPMSFGLEQRVEASEQAAALGRGVRMEVGSGATRFYAEADIPVGQIEVWRPLEYKGMLHRWGVLASAHDDWTPDLQAPGGSV